MELPFSCFFSLMLFAFPVCLYQLSVADHNSIASVQPLCHDDERFALLKFKQSLTFDESFCYDGSSKVIGSWNRKMEGENSSDCCSWGGVECDKDTGHVIKLNLSNSCLYGSINSTSTLFHLVHLEWLSLARNDFIFSKIPSRIMNLSKLSYLDLSNSYFAGQIPSEMLELHQLEYLNLSGYDEFPRRLHSRENWLQLPQPGPRSLGEKLTNLKWLDLTMVLMTSSIFPDSLGNLSSLTYLSLEDTEIQGPISSSIGNLTKLIDFHISYNDISSELPVEIGNLGSLQTLSISTCNISGQVLSLVKNLTQLSYLDLSYNNLQLQAQSSSTLSSITKLAKLSRLFLAGLNLFGEIPFLIMNLTQLTYLDMGWNQLTGPLPYWLFNLNQLLALDLQHNQLTGQIPSEIKNLTQLSYLDLSSNQFQGSIPSSISELKNLWYLNLYSNHLNGPVDLDMYLLKLKSLKVLVLSSNKFSVLTKITVNTTVQKFISIGLGSCNLTIFPNFLQNQDKLESLDLSSNNIPGQIPGWLLNISGGFMVSLNLSNNLLTRFDQHPVVLSGPYLDALDLRSNKLQGSLPLPPPYIKHYLASNNKLTGEIPPELCDCNQLRALDLSYNDLSGVLPQCLDNISYDLSILGLQGNNFHGRIPETFMIGPTLQMIDLSHNKFEGKIPRSLANCTYLEFLNFGYNQLTDTFPSWLGILPELKVLILKFNKFHGVIRQPNTNFKFVKLHIIDLSHNLFVGELPSKYFHSWNSMKVVNGSQLTYMEDILEPFRYRYFVYFDFSSYAYTFMMNNKGIELAYGKISNKLTSIILSENKFTGKIPTSISDLRALKNLNLSNNNLFGCIPSSLGNLTELESLDLSNNNLSGTIPQQLAALTFLEFINVSNNNLTGRIPQGHQFDTFDNKSFEGNLGLCGKPLSKGCKNSEASQREEDRGSMSAFAFDWKIVLIGFAGGLIVGIILGNEFCIKVLEWFETIFGRQLIRRGRGHRI